jgi:parallel beta-helix repeat protein
MKRSIYILIGCLIVAVGVSAQTATPTPRIPLHVCQDCGEPGAFTTITAALDAADDDDIINIWGEEDELKPGNVFEYQEHLVINKRITLTCDNPEPDLGYPIITHPFTGNPGNPVPPGEIIRIEPGGAGSVIKHLNIRGPEEGLITLCFLLYPCTTDDPMFCMGQYTGIRIEADNCTIHDVHITRCMTGIYMTGTGNYINGNYIGDRWLLKLGNTWLHEEYWSQTNNVVPLIHHPGNGFGIVAVEPDWSAPQGQSYESRSHNKISDNIIRSNRYWGVVLTNGSRAEVAHNIIAWNGDYSVENDWTSIPDKSGGLLSLFTASQISNNDNKLQAPIIRSNNIYGNKGYQIGVFTSAPDSGYDRCKQIYNSPVIMSNNIGVEDDMQPGVPVEEYDFLICAGPTPVSPPSEDPPPCDPDYPYFGSGPIFAWNNYHDPTDGYQRRMYHPMQKERWPTPVYVFTATPYPTPTPSFPTSTPTPAPPTHTPKFESKPTAQPINTATPVATHGPGYYQMNAPNWEIPGMKEDPRFVGWITPTPGYPPEFDWHLRDHSDDPERPASNCFNRGGIDLNPGTTRSDGLWDSGFVDMGRHVNERVSPVENLAIDWCNQNEPCVLLTWDAPTYYPDGSLFHFHDIGGYIVHFGSAKSAGNATGTSTLDQVVKPFLNPFFLDASTTEFSIPLNKIPRDATHLGVLIYTVRYAPSRILWIRIPELNP